MTTNQLNPAYTTLAYETSKKRITLAGYRLANYVINLYKNAPGREQKALIFDELNAEVQLPLSQRSTKQLWTFLADDSKKINLMKFAKKALNIRI